VMAFLSFFFFFFWDRVLQTTCPGWFWTAILLIFASWVARNTDVSHRCPAQSILLHSGQALIVWYFILFTPVTVLSLVK
jgi:hypothetical protein